MVPKMHQNIPFLHTQKSKNFLVRGHSLMGGRPHTPPLPTTGYVTGQKQVSCWLYQWANWACMGWGDTGQWMLCCI